jgi:hypothetical protein
MNEFKFTYSEPKIRTLIFSIIFYSVVSSLTFTNAITNNDEVCPQKMENLFLFYQSRSVDDLRESVFLYEVHNDTEKLIMKIPIPRRFIIHFCCFLHFIIILLFFYGFLFFFSHRLTSTEIEDKSFRLFASFVDDETKSTSLFVIHLRKKKNTQNTTQEQKTNKDR